jgi:hypothetical protein
MRKASFSSGGDWISSVQGVPSGLSHLPLPSRREAVLDQQLLGGFGIVLPPARAKDIARRARHGVALFFGPGGNLVGNRGIVGLVHLARRNLNFQVEQPLFHRLQVLCAQRRRGRHGHRRHFGDAADVLSLEVDDVQRQRQRPAHVLVGIDRVGFLVEDEVAHVDLIRVRPWELLVPGACGRRGVEHGLEGLEVHIEEDIQIAAAHGDGFLGAVAVEDSQHILGAGLADDDAGRRALPILAAFEEFPVTIRVSFDDIVRAQHDWLAEGEGDRVFDRLEDVLGHHVDAVPARLEEGVEARRRLVQVELDAEVAGLLDRV